MKEVKLGKVSYVLHSGFLWCPDKNFLTAANLVYGIYLPEHYDK